MDGKGHRLFAPIFTCGTSILLANAGIVPLTGDSLLATAIVATVCSLGTATLPDADQVALKPKQIIKGTAKERYSNKYKRNLYYVTMTTQKYQQLYGNNNNIKSEPGGKGMYVYYSKSGSRNPLQANTALLFKAMGLKRHRGWQSHSPLLWVPIWSLITYGAYQVPELGIFLGPVALGLGLGYTSHLVGDLFTMDGIPLFPKIGSRDHSDFKVAPFGAHIGNHKVFKFAKADNKIWVTLVSIIFINLFMYLLTPDLFNAFWTGVYNLLKTIFPVIGDIFKAIIDAILALLGHH